MKKGKERLGISDQEIIDRHFARLIRLLQKEERADRGRFKEEVLNKKPEEQARGGKALLRLSLYETHFNPSGQRLLTFGSRSGRPLPRYALYVGSIVRLSGFRTPLPDQPVGVVYEREKGTITVSFNGRLPVWVGREDSFNLTTAENLTTFERMYEAVKETGRARHNRIAQLRDISLKIRTPKSGDPVNERSVVYFNPDLNTVQKKAVCRALESSDLSIVHGPPGTGKTRVLIEIIQQAGKREESVLVSAPSNAACDLIVDALVERNIPVIRLGHPARMTESIREHTLSYKLARHPYAKMIDEHQQRLNQLWKQKERRQDRRVMSYEEKKAMRDEVSALRDDIRQLRSQIFHQVWNIADIVVATHTGCGDPLLKGRSFDWVILDEATQAIEPATLIPLLRAGRIVMAGDHCQLPPTVISGFGSRDGLGYTLFERLHDTLPEDYKTRLEVQYRMNSLIMNFSSKEFYDNQLKAHPGNEGHTLSDLQGVKHEHLDDHPVILLDTAGLGYEEKVDEGSGSRYNEEEAGLVVRQIKDLRKAGVPLKDIAVISPYSAQVKLLYQKIQGGDDSHEQQAGLEIDSIDAFQGREKEVVIVSLVRSNLEGSIGFLGDTRRMNVAMTRAKRKLIVIGDSATISSLPFYQDFINYVELTNGYRSAWEYVSG